MQHAKVFYISDSEEVNVITNRKLTALLYTIRRKKRESNKKRRNREKKREENNINWIKKCVVYKNIKKKKREK